MSSNIHIKRLKDILSRVGSVKSLTESSIRLAKIDRLFKSALPSLLADYCQVKACSAKELSIEAYSQAVATHLRFSSPQLLEKLKRHETLKQIEQITIRVGTLPQKTEPNTPARPNKVSQTNCDLLHATAKSIENKELSAALEHLAKTLENHRHKKTSR